jgi:hypothetical protein
MSLHVVDLRPEWGATLLLGAIQGSACHGERGACRPRGRCIASQWVCTAKHTVGLDRCKLMGQQSHPKPQQYCERDDRECRDNAGSLQALVLLERIEHHGLASSNANTSHARNALINQYCQLATTRLPFLSSIAVSRLTSFLPSLSFPHHAAPRQSHHPISSPQLQSHPLPSAEDAALPRSALDRDSPTPGRSPRSSRDPRPTVLCQVAASTASSGEAYPCHDSQAR